VGVELAGKSVDDRDRTAFADVNRRGAEARFDRGGGGLNIGTLQRHDYAGCAVVVDKLHPYAGGEAGLEKLLQGGGDFARGLFGAQPEAQLGPGACREDRLRAFALVAAGEAVDIASGPSPTAFDVRKAGLAPGALNRQLPMELVLAERQLAELLAFKFG